MSAVEKRSFCRICGAGCGIVVETDGNHVVRVRGDKQHAIMRGYTCPKGRALPQEQYDPHRLERPLIRDGGGLRETSWEILLDDFAAKLQRIIAEFGPRAVGVFIGGGGYLDAAGYLSFRSFVDALKTPSVYSDVSIDNLCKVVVPEMMCGISGVGNRADLERCDLLMFVGTNPVISHGHTVTLNASSPAAAIRNVKSRGSVWVIDPRRTETAQKATGHLEARPGTDYAILAYLIRELLRDGADHEYIAQHTQGVDVLRMAVEPFSIEHARSVSGVAAEDMAELLAAVRRAKRLNVDIGTGVTMSPSANVTQWLSWALMIVTGSLDREGGAWVSPGLLNRLDRIAIPPAPEAGWQQPGPESHPELPSVVGEYPCAAMPDEIEAGHLRALVVFGGNLAACMPHVGRTMAALEKLEVLATVDIKQTKTTEISTHVLPATAQLERADLSYATDFFAPTMAAQYTPAMVAPVGGCKAYWWMFGQLGKRMGIDFFPGINIDTATDDDVLAFIMSKTKISFQDIRSKLLITEPPQIGWLERYVDQKIGGWRLAPSPLVDQLKTMQEPASLVLIPRRQKYHQNARLLDLRDKPCIFVSRGDAEAAGLKNGATIEVRSRHGSLQGVMKIDPTLRPGAMTVPHGWSGQYNVNRLTGTDDVDPLTGMVCYSGLPVSLHPV